MGYSEEPWHDYSLRIYRGYVDNAGTISARDTYQELNMGSDEEIGLGHTMVMNSCFDLELGLSKLDAHAIQQNLPQSASKNNSMAIRLKINRINMTGKLRYNTHRGRLVPWLGAGLNAGLIETIEQERIHTPNGYISKPKKRKISTSAGLHGAGGIDIYPVKNSALALAIEVKYNISDISGPFKGNIDGYSVILGVKWDFGLRTD